MRFLLVFPVLAVGLSPVACKRPTRRPTSPTTSCRSSRRSARSATPTARTRAALSFDTRADVAQGEGRRRRQVGGERDSSSASRSTDPEMRMPPKGDPLTREGGRGPGEVDRRGAAVGAGVHLQGRDLRRAAEAAQGRAAGREPGREHPIDRILDAYFAANKVDAARAARRRGVRRAASTSTSSACCRRAGELDAFLRRHGRRTSERSSSAALLAEDGPTPTTGSRSGTTCCATTTPAPATSTAAASRSPPGCTSRCWRTSRTTSSSAS